jgi:hypothetical protein
MQDYLWAVDFFDYELLHQNPDALEALRNNPQIVYKPNEDGDNFFNAVRMLNDKSAEEQRRLLTSEKALREWMSQSFGVDLKHISRWNACLRFERFRTAFFELVQSHYGRGCFNVTLAERIVSSRLDEVCLFLILQLADVNLAILTLVRFG